MGNQRATESMRNAAARLQRWQRNVVSARGMFGFTDDGFVSLFFALFCFSRNLLLFRTVRSNLLRLAAKDSRYFGSAPLKNLTSGTVLLRTLSELSFRMSPGRRAHESPIRVGRTICSVGTELRSVWTVILATADSRVRSPLVDNGEITEKSSRRRNRM
uniref:(northern house mosquito) hypothetical protein n=1 Tax=Culex pipiens TaxID=7175 RepID=A0A8D8ARI2_CULPI